MAGYGSEAGVGVTLLAMEPQLSPSSKPPSSYQSESAADSKYGDSSANIDSQTVLDGPSKELVVVTCGRETVEARA